jgi:hypothetical protein
MTRLKGWLALKICEILRMLDRLTDLASFPEQIPPACGLPTKEFERFVLDWGAMGTRPVFSLPYLARKPD